MKPVEYLSKIEPVVIALFQALVHAERRAHEEHKIFAPLLEYHKYQFDRWSQIEGYDDARLNYADMKVTEANEVLFLIHTATAAAASGVLQIARQCVSMAWPKVHRLNKGRLVGSQSLSSVIWHARNQALHFEEGAPTNLQTRQCLDLLHKELGLDNSDLGSTPRSLAKDVISLLGWHSYEAFANEMIVLLGSD